MIRGPYSALIFVHVAMEKPRHARKLPPFLDPHLTRFDFDPLFSRVSYVLIVYARLREDEASNL